MARWLFDAEELLEAIQRCEPGVDARIHKKFLRRHWVVRVVRPWGVVEYEDINHYWLACGIASMFGGGGGE